MRQLRIDRNMSSRTTTVSSSAAFRVPILPHTAPAAAQPPNFQLPLLPHQLRALNRCLVIEQDGGNLARDFGNRFDYRSRGGCLADAVGVGKTATILGLVLASPSASDEDTAAATLVVAPAHLIPQWKHEIRKFTGNAIQVLVGKEEYEREITQPLPPPCMTRIVLVSVDTVLNEEKLWYDFRRVFTKEPREGGRQVKVVKPDLMALYKKAALFCAKSPKGPCSYEGWVYTGSLHLPQKPWRRVIFDEIQDLVSEGTVSQKNLLQLSRTANHVWLLSATPFPHGNSSVYANHELLGFCRLRIDVEVEHALPATHTFERIKRKLYIRSPRHVADQAVTASQSVTRTTQIVPQMDLERRFYEVESHSIRNSDGFEPTAGLFGSVYYPLREMTVHPEASEQLREQMSRSQQRQGGGASVRPVSASVTAAAARAVAKARERLGKLTRTELVRAHKQLRDSTRSLQLAEMILELRARPVAANPFAAAGPLRAIRDREAQMVHDHYCTCKAGLGSSECIADRHVFFRITREEGSLESEFIQGYEATKRVIRYLDGLRQSNNNNDNRQSMSLGQYIMHSKRSVDIRKKSLQNLEKEKRDLTLRIETLSKSSASGTAKQELDSLAAKHGSKPAALVRFLQAVTQNGEQVIVFSYWYDTLKLIGNTLRLCGLHSVFCGGSGNAMSDALRDFTSGGAPIILLSAQSKASGANLQCATQVVLLDPAGSSPEHGSILEEQAIGRAVRMGQKRPVMVTRFCVTGTIEEQLFSQIDAAAASALTRASDSNYVIQDCHKAAPENKKPIAAAAAAKIESSNDDDIEITAAVSASERIRLTFQNAKENGNVISLDSDDDEEENLMSSTYVPAGKTPAAANGSSAKQESAAAGKRSDADTDWNQLSEPREIKRPRGEEMKQTPFPLINSMRGVTPATQGSVVNATSLSPADAVTVSSQKGTPRLALAAETEKVASSTVYI